MGPVVTEIPPFLDALYANLLERGIQYFFPSVRLEALGTSPHSAVIQYAKSAEGIAALDWLGSHYGLIQDGRPLTRNERKLIKSIGKVLTARYRLLYDHELAPQALVYFRGLPEDRYVSAFLDPLPYSDPSIRLNVPDRIADAMEVLRISALSTYENRRIVTGVLIFGAQPDPCHIPPVRPVGALPYSSSLTAIRSFHRLCDGLQSVALVNEEGLLVELVDLQEWTHPYAKYDMPVPCAARYEAHCRATLCGGHTCLVLTPNGEIKIFAEGTQVMNFIDGKWRLTDAIEKYEQWEAALGNRRLAERIYRVALNLAEERRGGLFVVLNDNSYAAKLLGPSDLLSSEVADERSGSRSKDQLHYLLRNKRLDELPPSVLESIARIDGGIVLDDTTRLLAFGAILRLDRPASERRSVTEGGRTAAAVDASRYAKVLKVSEDGIVSFYRDGACVWEM